MSTVRAAVEVLYRASPAPSPVCPAFTPRCDLGGSRLVPSLAWMELWIQILEPMTQFAAGDVGEAPELLQAMPGTTVRQRQPADW